MKQVRKYANKPHDDLRFYGYFGLVVVITVFYSLFWGILQQGQ
jgi:hypothetical protein